MLHSRLAWPGVGEGNHLAAQWNRTGNRGRGNPGRRAGLAGIHKRIVFSREALAQAPYHDILDRIGYSNSWVLWENYVNELTNYATKKTLEKVSSNGQTWSQLLAGVDVMTKYHAYSVVEALRLQWGEMSKMDQLMALIAAPRRHRARAPLKSDSTVVQRGHTS